MRLDKLRDILNLPFDGVVMIYEFFSKKHTQDEHYKTVQGIDVTLVIDESGNLKRMRLFRNFAYFSQIGFGDTLYSIEVDYDRQWKKLSNAILNKAPEDLPLTFHWHKASGRAYRQEDGEIFSLGQEHVRAIQNIIDQFNNRNME